LQGLAYFAHLARQAKDQSRAPPIISPKRPGPVPEQPVRICATGVSRPQNAKQLWHPGPEDRVRRPTTEQ